MILYSVKIGFEKAGTFIPLNGNPISQSANTALEYFFFPGNTNTVTTSALIKQGSLPDEFLLLDEDYVISETDDLDAGDQSTNVHLCILAQPTLRAS